jgi:hypothetical protein
MCTQLRYFTNCEVVKWRDRAAFVIALSTLQLSIINELRPCVEVLTGAVALMLPPLPAQPTLLKPAGPHGYEDRHIDRTLL